MSDAIRRAIRTGFQFIVAGGLTAIINELANGLEPVWQVTLQGVNTLLVSFAQNWLEDNASVPALLKAEASSGNNPVTVDPAA